MLQHGLPVLKNGTGIEGRGVQVRVGQVRVGQVRVGQVKAGHAILHGIHTRDARGDL